MSAVERLERWQRRELLVALAVPLGSAGLAYAAWALSERLQWWGPFDRGTFSWAVIIPLWVGGAAATGWIWSFLDASGRVRLAATVWLVEGAAVASTFWFVIVSETQHCETSPRSTSAEWLLPSLVIGALTGAIPPIAAHLSAREFGARRNGRAFTFVIGAFVVGTVLVALAFTWAVFTFGGCNRP